MLVQDFVNPTGELKFETNETQKSILLQMIDDEVAEVGNYGKPVVS